MSVTGKMAESTVRIECFNHNSDDRISIGTSFYCVFRQKLPVLITNKHVVKGFRSIRIFLPTTPDLHQATSERSRSVTYHQLNEIVVFHGNPNIDLAAIMLPPILDKNVNDGSTIHLPDISPDIFVTENIENQLRFVEDILVVGYPQGLWDKSRNLPLFRRGITSSPAMLDYDGQAKFLIDCSIFPGSSGSPVFLYNYPAYFEDGQFSLGERCSLLGIVSSVLIHKIEGMVVEIDIPTATTVSNLPMPSNLGVVVKAREILKLAEAIPD